MALFNFANIEKRINTVVLGKFANIALLDANDAPVLATLDQAEYNMGEFDMTREMRPQLTINKAVNGNLKRGDVLTPNPLQYTPEEVAAMPANYTLDALAEDDGYMQKWWVL